MGAEPWEALVSTAPTIMISVYWHPSRKAWRIQGQYQGKTTVVKDYSPATAGAPTPRDIRAIINAICAEADSWLW